ncbi:type II toxin-antitoxin system YafQ family toxin [Sulfurimonas sp. SWIR-19]|uniref:type II toxin-antitoxin system RelE/ParE family toxin n=1 Tax=Sulfurimonas sp. SWIR-19 TaxID=2878390 RepID=UPI001CF1B5DF|nr:type II toxin-antitoxin system YafQ family toxin [Sulfurimonas sp. SWIR-19]UCN01141.1 type II toxin-antitoxin system YafQ family toxin [Sulfurimonas sp. SWIR-19]
MQLFRTKTFIKEYAKVKMSNTQYVKYLKYLVFLLEEKTLPPEARDHQLSGEYNGFREFHIGGDLLVVYVIVDDILRLTRIGTHAQLFK